MSDSGISFDTHKMLFHSGDDECLIITNGNGHGHGDGGTDEADEDDDISNSTNDNSSITSSTANLILCEMTLLRESIATKKAEIMKILENNGEKSKLDEKICELQELQKRIIKLELKVQDVEKSCLSDADLHIESLRDIPGSLTDSEESRMHSCLYGDYIDRSYTRSLPSIDAAYRTSEHIITVPTYLMRGAGKQTHYEYEVKINLPEERWTLLRRYSRFRELKLSMQKRFGEKAAEIPFPRRELFASNTESVAKTRRRQLESYLRRLLVVCSKIPYSPIYEGEGRPGLNKRTLIELHPFFKKGLFETSKHMTG